MALNIKTFNPDNIKATSEDEKIYGDNNFTSIKYKYNGKEMPAIRIDGKFNLFRFRHNGKDSYSLAISCDSDNEPFFKKICKVISKQTCKVVSKSMCTQEDLELIKDNKSGKSVYCKLYTKKSGKVKCRLSLGSFQNEIGVEELVDENFKLSCIIKLYQVYIGSVKAMSFSVEEILVKDIESRRSYFKDEYESEEESEGSEAEDE